MYGLMKSKDLIVRIVGERSLDNTFTVMENYNEIYNPDKAVKISQDDIELLDRNINLLEMKMEQRVNFNQNTVAIRTLKNILKS